LVHTVTTTAANEADVEQVADLLHGKEEQVWADCATAALRAAWTVRICSGTSRPRPSDIAKLPEGRAKTKVQKRSTARPACARRWSIHFASSSASSAW
jgi:IS5 family transposase